jgi:hypothetical protein
LVRGKKFLLLHGGHIFLWVRKFQDEEIRAFTALL